MHNVQCIMYKLQCIMFDIEDSVLQYNIDDSGLFNFLNFYTMYYFVTTFLILYHICASDSGTYFTDTYVSTCIMYCVKLYIVKCTICTLYNVRLYILW